MPNLFNQQTDPEISREVGRRLQTYRLQQNLTVADVSRRAGLNRNTVLNAEHGANPRLETLVKLLRVLGRLDALEAFLPPPTVSPLQLLQHRGRARRRASRPRKSGKDRGADPHDHG